MADPIAPIQPTRRRALVALAGLLLVFLAPVVYYAGADLPGALRWAWPSWICMLAAVTLSFYAYVGDRRIWVRAVCGVNVAFFLAGLTAFLFLTRLPPASPPEVGAIAPDFTLPDHTGVPTRLAEVRSGGPVFLVFYRGHW